MDRKITKISKNNYKENKQKKKNKFGRRKK